MVDMAVTEDLEEVSVVALGEDMVDMEAMEDMVDMVDITVEVDTGVNFI